jgi:HPt (histidine-containing phosphotransfer) domain-containing protein
MIPVPSPLPPVSTPPGVSLDEAIWDAMLDTAGPQDAIWLVQQIAADLMRMQDGLMRVLAVEDCAALGRASHALAGLAGTIGAPQLHEAAQRLSDAASRGDKGALPVLGERVQEKLTSVLDWIAQRHADMGAA